MLNLRFGKFGSTAPFANRVGTMIFPVLKIFLMGRPSKIINTVPGATAVKMARFVLGWAWPHKCEKNEPMYSHSFLLSILNQIYTQITTAFRLYIWL